MNWWEWPQHIGQTYTITILHRPSGIQRQWSDEYPWAEGTEYLWSEGNFACDCNRELLFLRAGGVSESEINSRAPVRCGEVEYTVTKIIFADGAEYGIEEGDER